MAAASSTEHHEDGPTPPSLDERSGVPADLDDDLVLMDRFQSGDEAAYETLVRRHLDFVVRHARRYVNDLAGAEDVAQDVFLRLYRSRDRFREPNNFTGWLVTITSRIALNELRTRRRKRWVPRSSLEAEDPAQDWRPGSEAGSAPEDSLLREERIMAVRQALERLPENQRQAILLQKFEGWDLAQIGEAMDLSIPAVKSLLHRARRALEAILAPIIGEEETRRT